MNREIKFRAWDKVKKTMWQNVHFDYTHIYSDKWNEETETWLGQLPMPLGILLQFTGLKDKNGKEIYEGDIVKDDFGIREIEFFELSSPDNIPSGMGFNVSSTDNCEVIGNIYENPNLLK